MLYNYIVEIIFNEVETMSNFHIDVTGARFDPTFKIIPDAEDASDKPVEVNAYELREALNVAVNQAMFQFSGPIRNKISVEGDMALVGNASSLFSGFRNISGLEHLDTSKVTNMNHMFAGCDHVRKLDVSSFDTSHVYDMSYMFDGCKHLVNLDVSGFDTSNVEYMNRMFNDCDDLVELDVSNFDTSKVVNMQEMFRGCSDLTELDVSKFD